jgi:hypothetical protein
MRNALRVLIGVAAFTVATLAAAAVSYPAFGDIARNGNTEILRRALGEALGTKTNFGTPRIVDVHQENLQGKPTLVITLNANNNPTLAGLRHGTLADVVQVLAAAKSWGWADRVAQTTIGEYVPASRGPNTARLIMSCRVSSDTVRTRDWKSFDPRNIPDVADAFRFDGMVE